MWFEGLERVKGTTRSLGMEIQEEKNVIQRDRRMLGTARATVRMEEERGREETRRTIREVRPLNETRERR